MHITIQMLPELKLAGLPIAGPMPDLESAMPAIWKGFLARERELGGEDGPRYRVNLLDEAGIVIECVAGVVSDLNLVPAGMVALRVPARRYAVFAHRGPMATVQATYVTAFSAMEQLGLRHDTTGWRLERYDRRFTPGVDNPARPDNAYDILIPLRD
jgi:AraC family transcriptional regulator